ncbi:spermidine resistance protein [Actinomortierella ambigua]|nr:spermidine resistance protein [Actinomortierella ambigua]
MTVPISAAPPASVAASVASDLKTNHLHSVNNTTTTTTTTTTNAENNNINNNNNNNIAHAEPHHLPLHNNEAGFKNDAFLDTSNDSQEAGSFEGPEKLLEIWFGPAPYALQSIRTAPEAVQQSYPDSVPFEADEATDRYGLRIVPKTVWDTMLDIVKCKVLNQIQNDCMDAYLLSESSFFVYPHKLILKTCGTTTLLMALPKILEIAQKFCGLEKVWRVFYSRKTFMFPDRQLHVHRSWKDEVEFLDRHFEHGAAYTVGKVNGDHWCLYLTAPQDDCLSHITSRRNSMDLEDAKAAAAALAQAQAAAASAAEAEAIARAAHHHRQPLSIQTDRRGSVTHYDDSPVDSPSDSSTSSPSVASSSSSFSMSSTASSSASYLFPSHDQTVEILMTNLNPEAMKRFYQQPDDVPGTVGGVRVDQDTGLANLFPQAQLDSYLFTPCGYSANALQDGHYFTIHVTPEPVCSYASFETNIPVCVGKKRRTSSSSSSSSRRGSGRSTPQPQQSGNISTCEEGEMLTDDDNKKEEVEGVYGGGPETLTELISRVVEIFQPGTMSVTLFSSHMNEDGSLETERQAERRQRQMVKAMGRVKGFTRTDRILYEFEGCDLVFGHFEATNKA